MALGPAAIPSVKLVDNAASEEGTAGEHWRECGPAEDGEMPAWGEGDRADDRGEERIVDKAELNMVAEWD